MVKSRRELKKKNDPEADISHIIDDTDSCLLIYRKKNYKALRMTLVLSAHCISSTPVPLSTVRSCYSGRVSLRWDGPITGLMGSTDVDPYHDNLGELGS